MPSQDGSDPQALHERLDRIEALLRSGRSVRGLAMGLPPRRCHLSFVSPCFNEKDSLQSLHDGPASGR